MCNPFDNDFSSQVESSSRLFTIHTYHHDATTAFACLSLLRVQFHLLAICASPVAAGMDDFTLNVATGEKTPFAHDAITKRIKIVPKSRGITHLWAGNTQAEITK